MESAHLICLVLLPVLYTLLVMAYAKIFTRQASGLSLAVRPLLLITLAVHLGAIIIRGVHVGACPLGRPAEFLTLVSFAVATIYLFLELRVGDRATGVFVLALVFVIQIVGTISILISNTPGEYPVGTAESLYRTFAVLGYSAVAVSSTYGILYLFLYRAIKQGSFGLYYRKMPSLGTLSDLNYVAASLGFVALSVTVGVMLYRWQSEGTLGATSEMFLTLALWGLFGAGIAAKRFWSLGGKRLAYTTLLGSLFVLGILLSGLS